MNAFSKIAHAKEHLGYKSGNIYSHTIDKDNAKNFVNGYQKILNFYKFHLPAQNKCIDLGCGAGHLTNEFKNHGFDITGLEYSNDALDVAKKHNPHLNIVQGDMSKFNEPNSYDFIFSREVYIITRVNAFTDQKNIISNIVHSLKPRGGGIYACRK